MANEVEIIIRAVDKASGEINKISQKSKSGFDNIKKFAGTAALGIGAITGALYTAKKAFDFAKEGAQLEMVRGKFDNLSKSIGVTSDSLLSQLRNATRGTRSDMELVASATDFMSLGLAKTNDEVVRLTRVAGALNMDMNQLVLTLANKTTMRFDQLGVAVDGFDERLARLKATGMDANAAFTEAFLQQAEEQITKVGDIADTDAGKIMAMEASLKNLGDTAKLAAAPALGELAEQLTRILRESQDFNQQLKYAPQYVRRFDEEITMVKTATANWRDEGQQAVSMLNQQTQAAARSASSFDNQRRSIKIAAKGIDEAKEKYKKFLSILDSKVESPLAGFIEDLKWWQAGGFQINNAFLKLQEITQNPDLMAKPGALDSVLGASEELYATTIDVKEEMGLISGDEAAKNISDTLGWSLQEARDYIAGTDGLEEALDRVSSTMYTVNVDVVYREVNKPDAITDDTTPSPTRRRAAGGPVSLGLPYLVGENGPELFVPSTSGTVVSNDKLGGAGGGVYIEQNVYPSAGMDEMALAQYAGMVLTQRARRSALAGAGYVGI